MTLTKPDAPAPSTRLTLGDLVPTAAVAAITTGAAALHYLPVAVPGFVLTLAMTVVTFHPRHTLSSIVRRPR